MRKFCLLLIILTALGPKQAGAAAIPGNQGSNIGSAGNTDLDNLLRRIERDVDRLSRRLDDDLANVERKTQSRHRIAPGPRPARRTP